MPSSPDPAQTYIWICRWADFQHYPPERDRAPYFLKDYTKQLDEERFITLSMHQRGILHSLRIAFARAHGRLPADTRQLSHRLHGKVTTVQLEALNQAGLIEFLSRHDLDQRLDEVYSESRPHARARRVRSKKEELGALSRQNSRYPCPVCGIPRPSRLALREHIELVHDLTPNRILSEDE